jgi:predicted patatin/cPLA2 family phospholipase
LRYNTRYSRDVRYCSFFSLLFTGNLYGADFCYRRLPEELDLFDWKQYRENPMEFFAVCTNVKSGKAEYFSCEGEKERVMEVFRASASMPLVSRMVTIDGEKYLDGGISSSIPLAFMEDRGYEKNAVILTQPRDFVKKPNSAMGLIRARYGKYPELCHAMEQRHKIYNREKEEVFLREKEGKAFVFAPGEPLGVKRMERDPKKLRSAYEQGRCDALARKEEWLEFFK